MKILITSILIILSINGFANLDSLVCIKEHNILLKINEENQDFVTVFEKNSNSHQTTFVSEKNNSAFVILSSEDDSSVNEEINEEDYEFFNLIENHTIGNLEGDFYTLVSASEENTPPILIALFYVKNHDMPLCITMTYPILKDTKHKENGVEFAKFIEGITLGCKQ